VVCMVGGGGDRPIAALGNAKRGKRGKKDRVVQTASMICREERGGGVRGGRAIIFLLCCRKKEGEGGGKQIFGAIVEDEAGKEGGTHECVPSHHCKAGMKEGETLRRPTNDKEEEGGTTHSPETIY